MKKHSPLQLEDILTDHIREADLLEVPLTRPVFRGVFIGAFLIGVLVLWQLGYLGVIQHNTYAERAFANMSDTTVLHAPRGIVYDRFGVPIIENEDSFNVVVIPRYLPANISSRTDILKRLSELTGVDLKELEDRISKRDWSVSDRLLVANELTHEQIIEIASENITAVKLEPSFSRVPKSPYAFSHVVGYTGLVNTRDLKTNNLLTLDSEIGRAGLEAWYDVLLRGMDGEEVVFQDAQGEGGEAQKTREPEIGSTLHTAIDAELQEYFYKSLTNTLANLGRESGVGIALNPQNGEVHALVSIPSFDVQRPEQFLNKPNEPFFNRAISGLYNPGSTIKPLVAVAALAENIIDPLEQIFSSGHIEIPNPYNPDKPSRFLDWKPHGWVDLYAALARSSNVYFYEVGGGFEKQKGLGIYKLNDWWSAFGLDKLTNIDLVGENKGFLPTPEWKSELRNDPWRIGDTYNVSIGQGDLLITPLELLNYIAAIANGGTLYQPRVVTSVVTPHGEIKKTYPPRIIGSLPENATSILGEVQSGMKDAVSTQTGTAHLLNTLPMSVAAKTGSAQVANNTKTNAFFVGYAPTEKPTIAILVLIEDALEGSLNAVPVARDVLLWYYEHRLERNNQ